MANLAESSPPHVSSLSARAFAFAHAVPPVAYWIALYAYFEYLRSGCGAAALDGRGDRATDGGSVTAADRVLVDGLKLLARVDAVRAGAEGGGISKDGSAACESRGGRGIGAGLGGGIDSTATLEATMVNGVGGIRTSAAIEWLHGIRLELMLAHYVQQCRRRRAWARLAASTSAKCLPATMVPLPLPARPSQPPSPQRLAMTASAILQSFPLSPCALRAWLEAERRCTMGAVRLRGALRNRWRCGGWYVVARPAVLCCVLLCRKIRYLRFVNARRLLMGLSMCFQVRP
jgi:hypothetical protein